MATLANSAAIAQLHESVDEVLKLVKDVQEEHKIQRREVAELKEKTAVAQYPNGVPAGGPYGQIGSSVGISQGFSYQRLALGCIKGREYAKYEFDVCEKLKNLYLTKNFAPGYMNSLLVPYGTTMIPAGNTEEERLVGELREKAAADRQKTIDQDEVAWLHRKMNPGLRQKDLSTLVDTQGGVLVGFPTLMELVDIQRNMEVFSRAGATEVGLPANGRMQYPKLTNVTTAYWVGEGATVTESTPATGYLDLQAKKLGILVDFNNELLRFSSVAAEGMVRGDMAKVAALKSDLAMLEGTGGTQIKGLITYDSAASWSTGNDKLLAYTVTSNLLQVKDAAEMEALLPDTAGEPTAWVMRRNLWAKLRNRRAGASTATDEGGPYLASITRSLQERQRYEWDGTPVVRSSQVSNTRGSGSQTYVILGYFPDWITARFGVLEFLASNVGDTQMTNDQTRLRCIQHIDAGARHASSFVFADAITIS